MHPPKFINSRAVQSICRHLDCEHRKYTDSGSAKAETSIKVRFRKSCSIGDPETYIRFGKNDLVSLATATRLLDFWTNSFLVGTGTDYFWYFFLTSKMQNKILPSLFLLEQILSSLPFYYLVVVIFVI